MKQWILSLLTRRATGDQSISLNWLGSRHLPVQSINQRQVRIGQTLYRFEALKFDTLPQEVSERDLRDALLRYGQDIHPLHNSLTPQLAAPIYDVTRDPQTMSMYFPITEALNDEERILFENTVSQLTRHVNFNLRIWKAKTVDVTPSAPPCIAYLVAGHIVEVLFHRIDLLDHLFSTKRNFDIYMSEQAYADAGGIAGGCFDVRSESIKLVASRLFEGYFAEAPGVAPFIHEFGHMLDSFDSSTATIRPGHGLLPGLDERDGLFFSPEARELFIEGKSLELERYERARLRRPSHDDNIPIGHPYVFQNDGEFIAGYLEMFFRNPNYFHRMNPTLFDGLSKLFNQDPRIYWKQDFDYYIQQNRAVYLVHRQGIGPAGLRIPS